LIKTPYAVMNVSHSSEGTVHRVRHTKRPVLKRDRVDYERECIAFDGESCP
jgi:hypothetical protein